ncbi:P-loop NTPase [Acidianus sulfidivorans JP7]|uniref:ATP-binding protein n=2 Tax=Acidianus TaxID=12914 RepID=A0A2U9IL96_9CREN|nr:P-loop NTPase [Acidianus sulfidivorans JP7]
MSAKGGVGKSIVSSLLALSFSEIEDTILIDLDIHTMAVTKLFGFENKLHNVTKNGIEPFKVSNSLGIVSLGGIVKDNYVILPGRNNENVMESLIAYTDMKNSERIIFDLPPGLGDETLVLERLINNSNDEKYSPIVVTTPSKISVKVVEYLIKYLNERKYNPLLVVNMAYLDCGKIVRPFGKIDNINTISEKYRIKYFELPIDSNVEDYIGNIQNYNGTLREKIKELALNYK